MAAPLLFFFFRLFFLAASSAVEVAPSSLSSGSKSPFRWLPEDAASSTPAMLPERARGSETERRGPAPPSATYAGDAGSRSQWWGAGNAGTAEDSIAGTAHRRLTDWPAGCSPDAAAAVPEVGLSRPGCGFLGQSGHFPCPAPWAFLGLICPRRVELNACARAPSAREGRFCWHRKVLYSVF